MVTTPTLSGAHFPGSGSLDLAVPGGMTGLVEVNLWQGQCWCSADVLTVFGGNRIIECFGLEGTFRGHLNLPAMSGDIIN